MNRGNEISELFLLDRLKVINSENGGSSFFLRRFAEFQEQFNAVVLKISAIRRFWFLLERRTKFNVVVLSPFTQSTSSRHPDIGPNRNFNPSMATRNMMTAKGLVPPLFRISPLRPVESSVAGSGFDSAINFNARARYS